MFNITGFLSYVIINTFTPGPVNIIMAILLIYSASSLINIKDIINLNIMLNTNIYNVYERGIIK